MSEKLPGRSFKRIAESLQFKLFQHLQPLSTNNVFLGFYERR
ncbi:MAG: hypothetical protein JWR54_1253 [Mucilaginibacter sp.]|nr:hypothetical protein [Mucilaginibacter sp.]